MTRFTGSRFALALFGILVFAVGAAMNDQTFRWIGLAFLFVAVILRFFEPRPPPERPEEWMEIEDAPPEAGESPPEERGGRGPDQAEPR